MLKLKEGVRTTLKLQVTSGEAPYTGEVSFGVYNSKGDVVWQKELQVELGEVEVVLPKIKENNYRFTLETDDGYSDVEDMTVVKSIRGEKEELQKNYTIDISNRWEDDYDIEGEKKLLMRDFYINNGRKLKRLETDFEDSKKEQQESKKELLEHVNSSKKDILTDLGVFSKKIETQIQVEEEKRISFEKRSEEDKQQLITDVSSFKQETKERFLKNEQNISEIGKELSESIKKQGENGLSMLAKIKSVEKSIPTGGILDYEVDDDGLSSKILRSSEKINNRIKGEVGRQKKYVSYQNMFDTITVSGQDTIQPDSPLDSLEIVAGSNITITTDNENKTITFASTGGGVGAIDRGDIGGTLSNQTDLQAALDAKANTSHTHDDRYYTETEVDTLLSGKAASSHTHTLANITDAGTAAAANTGTGSGNVPVLNGSGKLSTSVLPDLAISTYLGNFADTTAALADAGVGASQRGDWFTLDTDESYIVTSDSPTTTGHITKLKTPTGAVSSVNGLTGVVVLDPDDLDDTATTHKFVTSTEITKLGHISVTQAVDLDTIESNASTAYTHSQLTTGNPHNVTKSDVGLGSVENTALSTWAGSTNITTLGTIATGTWNATTIGVSKGGTGLTSIAALSIPVANSANTYTTVTPTAGQSVRVNAGGTAWEAYTPGSGGGDVTAASSFGTDNVLIKSDGTGKGVQSTGISVSDNNAVAITIADTINEIGLTITQNDVTNSAPALKVVASLPYVTNPENYPVCYKNSDAGSDGFYLSFFKDSASPAVNDYIGGEDFYGRDNLGNIELYAYFNAIISDPTSGSEDASFVIATKIAGTARILLDVGDGINGITVGSSSVGAGVVRSGGNQDLVLQTGNATTGTITITDGADGNINIAPNGTGRLQAGGVNVPTISSTDTLTNKTIDLTSNTLVGSVAEFNTALESADFYTTGGTDVAVGDGGTGRSSHTAYAVLCGGTTTTGAQQSVASVGTAGQVLTSNGAGALPSFQDAAGGGMTTIATQQVRTSTFTVTRTDNDTITYTAASSGLATIIANTIIGRLARWTDSGGGTVRRGRVRNATASTTTVTIELQGDVFASGDTNFRISITEKVQMIDRYIPGEQITDASNPQGKQYVSPTGQDRRALSMNAYVGTAAAGAGAACAINIYDDGTNIFTSAVDLTTATSALNQLPNTTLSTGGSRFTLRVTSSAGATNKASDLNVQLFYCNDDLFDAV